MMCHGGNSQLVKRLGNRLRSSEPLECTGPAGSNPGVASHYCNSDRLRPARDKHYY